MIGGIRIIGGNKDFWIRGYTNGLRECLKTNGEMKKLINLAEKVGKRLLNALGKEQLDDEITEISAFQSAVIDVLHTYSAFISLFGCKEFTWDFIRKRIIDVLSEFEEVMSGEAKKMD